MAQYPIVPAPSSVSAHASIDPVLRYATDSGVEIRRAAHSRPRRRYTLEYLGGTTEYMRLIRDFVYSQRANVLPFQFYHPTAVDVATVQNTTPVILTYPHDMVTGQWVGLGQAPGPLNGFWQVTRLGPYDLALNGSGASGAGTAHVIQYLPQAIAIFDQDIWSAPTKIIGPDQIAAGNFRSGMFSWTLDIEEVF
jgi:hypothetical protein